VLFPITHGVFGEDGTLQGVLTHLNIPYVGPNVLGSAMGMDKDITKKLAKLAGVQVTPSETHYKGDKVDVLKTIDNLGLPVFVKPVNMGSGVGVIKASDKNSLERAIETAFNFDTKILIEKAIVGRELETAVLGNNSPKVTSVGEIVIKDDYYTYENKYENDKAKVVIPAENLSNGSISLIQKMALTTYKALELEGLTRVDFFYVSDDEIYLNEVNTLPGFTNISMYPKLWENMGLSYAELITELIQHAQDRFHKQSQLRREK
jgi:D-alanine-D-alanine ligase